MDFTEHVNARAREEGGNLLTPPGVHVHHGHGSMELECTHAREGGNLMTSARPWSPDPKL